MGISRCPWVANSGSACQEIVIDSNQLSAVSALVVRGDGSANRMKKERFTLQRAAFFEVRLLHYRPPDLTNQVQRCAKYFEQDCGDRDHGNNRVGHGSRPRPTERPQKGGELSWWNV
jgi:hypothetical protein